MACVDASREKRLAKNEAFFRSVNETIRDVAAQHGPDAHVYEFLCECSDPACVDRVALTTADYEKIREDGARFVLMAGHNVAEIEDVVSSSGGHVVVEKVGLAGEVAEELDPRAS